MKEGCLYQCGLEEVGMENIFLTKLDIVSVRHLHGIAIPLSDTVRKHLILTGKNGSGKTSTLERLKEHLEFIISNTTEAGIAFDSSDTDFTKTLNSRPG